jgi:hypothetical protein
MGNDLLPAPDDIKDDFEKKVIWYFRFIGHQELKEVCLNDSRLQPKFQDFLLTSDPVSRFGTSLPMTVSSGLNLCPKALLFLSPIDSP